MIAHVLFKTGDKDAPDVIKDRNGEVVLGLCRKCGQAEAELEDNCPGTHCPRTELRCDRPRCDANWCDREEHYP